MAINFSLRKYRNPFFVETGTFDGDGVKKALWAGFKRIYSIEFSETLYKDAVIKFEKEIRKGRVKLILGDSSVCLPNILKNIDRRITFWLDAHFSSGDTARASKDVPLLEELDAIAKHPINTHTIIIDDLRLFGTNYNENWSDIRLDRVIEKLKQINKNYSISYENGLIKDDVLVAEIRVFSVYKILGRIEELAEPTVKAIFHRIKRLGKQIEKKSYRMIMMVRKRNY